MTPYLKTARVMCLLGLGFWTQAFAQTKTPNDDVFQLSTLSALSAGVFDGDTTVAELKRHGDFGLGTFNGVDGEMIILNGEVYQVPADGVARFADANTGVPFAAVTTFTPDRTATTNLTMSCAELETFITTLLPSQNVIYSLKVQGTFESLKVRSEAKQQPPYTTLADVLKNQVLFDYQNLQGILVGFWFPAYAEGINVTGYHFHALSAGRTKGGHVLDCQVKQARISLDTSSGLTLHLPDTDAFMNADLAE